MAYADSVASSFAEPGGAEIAGYDLDGDIEPWGQVGAPDLADGEDSDRDFIEVIFQTLWTCL